MKHYIIMRNEAGTISRIDRYCKETVNIESLKQKIGEWTEAHKGQLDIPELITDPKAIEILNYIFKNYDDTDLQAKCERLEDKIEDIRKIIGCGW